MIDIRNKDDCCGCTTCASICPKQCITMKPDMEGFLYPFVESNKCIDCHLCENKCPIIGKEKIKAAQGVEKEEVNKRAIEAAKHQPDTFVCSSEFGNQSTSGGVFSVLAQYILEQDGIVCGVILNEEQKVVHAFAENESELSKMRRSKYVQSDQNGVYDRIRRELKGERLVLYSGTPCQVAGLKCFLGHNYDNLIMVDIFCHGIGSPLYWKKYVDFMSKKMHSPIKEVRFREKTYGYNSSCLALYFENGRSIRKGHDDDLYWSPFSKNMIYRPSCYACAFKSVNHVSDFTIGDFWNTNELPEVFKKADGCSLMLCHSVKSNTIFKEIEKKTAIVSIDLEKALNINGGHQPSMLITCPSIPENRRAWFNDMNDLTPQEMFNKYIPLGIKGRIKSAVKPILFKMGLLEFLKKKIGKVS